MQPVKTHGVLRRDSASTDVERHVEEIRRIGVTIIRNAFSKEQMERARGLLQQIYAAQVDEIGGEDRLFSINDANIVRTPLAYDDLFIDIAKQPTVLAVARTCLGDAISLSSQVGILNRPGITNYQEGWHRELQYQHFTSSRPLAVQTLVAVDDFTFENGATFFLPGSHLFENFPSEDFVRKWEIQFEAPAGSIFMFDSLLYHRGAQNRSTGPRVAINNLYTLPIIAQQIDMASMLKGRHAETLEDRQLFGYQWNPPRDAATWRRQKLAAKAKA